MTFKRVFGKVTAGLGITTAVVILLATAVLAAGNWYPISGTVYESGAWYESSTVRWEGLNNNTILLKLTSSPCDGIDFRLLENGTGRQIGTTQTWYNGASGTKTLATNVAKGKYFQNDFRVHFSNNASGCYNFAGTEQY
jgi:hypothetical protein